MLTYRITYIEPDFNQSLTDTLGASRIVPKDKQLTTPCKIELSSSEGDVFRFQKESEICLKETEEGGKLEVYGETFGITGGSKQKYRTTCYYRRLHTSPPLQLLIKPSAKREYMDEYLLAMGYMVIYDFDEHGGYYVICQMKQGDKVYVSYNPNIPYGQSRYNASIEKMTDEDWTYIHQEYLDNQNWMYRT